MKGSIALVIGGVVVVGIAAYVIYKQLQPTKEEPSQQSNTPVCKKEPATSDYTQVKEDAASAIKDRHVEAAQVINESLQTIFNEKDIENVETENGETLDKIDDALDDLLK